MQKLSRLTAEAQEWRALNERLDTASELATLAGPDDPGMLADLAIEAEELTRLVDERDLAVAWRDL